MRNLKRTTTAVALTAGLSLSAVAPAVANEDGDRSSERQRTDVVRDVQGTSGETDLSLGDVLDDLEARGFDTGDVAGNGNGNGNGSFSGNDVGGVGNGNHTEVGNGDVEADPQVDPEVNVDPEVDGGDDGDVVDDDSQSSEQSSDDDRRSDHDESQDEDGDDEEQEQGDLLGGLL